MRKAIVATTVVFTLVTGQPLVLDPSGHPVGMYSRTPLAPAGEAR